MYLLNEKKLNKGDIILLKFETEKSKLIRRFSNSKFSHAMVYMGGSSLIDADGPGVHAHNLQRLLIPNKDDVVILRSKNASTDQLWKVEQFVRSKVGTDYSMEEARKVVRNGEFVPEDNRQFCTRLVAKSFEFAGSNIVEKPDYCSPKDIEDSNELSAIQGVTRAANEKEINYANETDTPLQKQEELTNKILAEVRAFTGKDIQTFEQLDEFLTEHPEHDAKVIRIVTDSEYLKLWETDIKKNPWHYDFEKDDPALMAEYKAYHQRVWPEIIKNIKEAGITVLDIYCAGNRMFRIIEAGADFSFEKKSDMDAGSPKVQEWEELM